MNYSNNNNNNNNFLDYINNIYPQGKKYLNLPVLFKDGRFFLEDFFLDLSINSYLDLGFTYRVTVTYDRKPVRGKGIPFPSLLFSNRDNSSLKKIELLDNNRVIKFDVPDIIMEDIVESKVDLSNFLFIDTLSEEQIASFTVLSDKDKTGFLENLLSKRNIEFEKHKLKSQILTIINHRDINILKYDFKIDYVKSTSIQGFELECIKSDF